MDVKRTYAKVYHLVKSIKDKDINIYPFTVVMHQSRSNILFQKRGLEKKIAYQISLSRSRNPDFVVHHPNETEPKNKAGWKSDIKKRVEHEEDLRLAVIASRLAKRKGDKV